MFRNLLERLLKVPAPQDFTSVLSLETTGKPNQAFIVPPGTTFKTGSSHKTILVSPRYALDASGLYQKVHAYLMQVRGAALLNEYTNENKAVYCVRTQTMRYPDLVYVQATDSDLPSQSDLQAYSHSVFGYSDMGANAKRLADIINTLKPDEIDTNFA